MGGTRPVRADVRVFASSRNDELSQRLGGITLTLPPLRDRPADVPLLARHFVDRYDGHKKLTSRALEALQRYTWPGNVRELQMLIRRAAALVAKDVIDAEDLPPDLREQGGKPAPRTGLSLAEMEKEYIELVLRQNEGHRGKTARALYRWRNHSFLLSGRGNWNTGKGYVHAAWTTPRLLGLFRGYVQVTSGYGESLIDYNHNQTTIGAGIALSDGL